MKQTPGQACVRVTRWREDGFVEFDFSLGDADLYLEMILPRKAFEEFCTAYAVAYLSDSDAALLDADRRKWREGGL